MNSDTPKQGQVYLSQLQCKCTRNKHKNLLWSFYDHKMKLATWFRSGWSPKSAIHAKLRRRKQNLNSFSWGSCRPPDPPFESAYRPPGLLAGLLACWLAGFLAGLLACWLAGLLACWLAGWLACRLAGWLAGLLAGSQKKNLDSCLDRI